MRYIYFVYELEEYQMPSNQDSCYAYDENDFQVEKPPREEFDPQGQSSYTRKKMDGIRFLPRIFPDDVLTRRERRLLY